MKWFRIILFYSIALIGSYLFRIIKPDILFHLNLPYGLQVFTTILEGIGPFVGALIILIIFRPSRKVSFWGSSLKKSISMLLLPIILLSIFGIENKEDLNKHCLGFIVGLTSIVYVIFEEFGWRAYLLQELKIKQLNIGLRSIIIGALWYIWHLNFSITLDNYIEHLVFLAILIFASWGFEKILDSTKSIVSVACFHFLGSLMTYNQLLNNGLSSQNRTIIFIICLISWIAFVSKWKSTSSNNL